MKVTGKHRIKAGARCLEPGDRTLIMGVLNVTPDSFSDGGRFSTVETATACGLDMAEAGADIIDIGGESTRPFSDPVSEEEEIRRVIPVVEKLVPRIPVPVSVDTVRSKTAKLALNAGASMINDVSALRSDPELGKVIAEHDVPVVLMHMKGDPKTMQVKPDYNHLMDEIKEFLENAVERAVKAGIRKSNIIIDPGIGFGKTFAHNLTILNRLNELDELNLPILVGTSRKAFIRNLLKAKGEKDPDPNHPTVETGTQATVAVAVLNGANIVRVHGVADTLATLKVVDAIRKAQ